MHQGEYYYDIVKQTVQKFPDLSIVEIGTDGGNTAFWAMKAFRELNFKSWFFTIDPYGDKPYKAGGDTQGTNMGYNDKSYMTTVPQLYKFASQHGINYLHWKLTSLDWMKIFPQVTFWTGGSSADLKFSMAFLDGDHNWDPVEAEFNFFYDRIPEGGYIVIDDFNLLGGEPEVRQRITREGKWFFNYDDNHYRCYFQKLQSAPLQ